jgi:hypothetical protein
MRNTLLYLVAFIMLIATPALAQQTAIPKLIISEGETYVVGPSNFLLVDTLIIQDKATLMFAPEYIGILHARVAFIGNSCTISSKGKDGEHHGIKTKGTAGQKGGDLAIIIHFEKLGSLTVDTSGGKGGDGKKGKDGLVQGSSNIGYENFLYRSTSSSDGEPGHIGGNGGNIDLTYSTAGFIPVFNNSKARNHIKLYTSAGDAGRDGAIISHIKFITPDGKAVNNALSKPKDGEIKLINANAPLSVQD